MNWTFFAGGILTTTALTPTSLTTTQCTVTVPASLILAAGTASITVVNPGSPAKTSNAVFFPVTKPATQLGFNQTSVAVGTSPQSVAAGDFNGDGILDLAVVNKSSNTVSILLGNGGGTFQTQKTYSTGAGPEWIIAADFNNDGKLDLATANFTANTVSVLMGVGDGTFTAKSDTTIIDKGPDSLAAGDFNGDGNMDLAVTNVTQGTLLVLLGKGDGTFTVNPPITIPGGRGPSTPDAVAVGDFNGDGILDLVTTDSIPGTVAILLGKGDGSFVVPPLTFTVANGPTSVVVADFDGDGNADLAVADSKSNGITVLLGNGDGTFKQPGVLYGVDAGPVVVVAADFSGDGKLDLIVSSMTLNKITVLRGNGDGTFRSGGDFSAGSSPVGVAAGDFNGSGQLGVAVSDSGGKAVGILLQIPTVLLSPLSLTFGNQIDGTTSQPQTSTLSNISSSTLTIQGITITGANSGDFAETNTCGSSLAPGLSCTISATFTPSITGAETASISVADNAQQSPQSVTLTGTGIKSGVPAANVSPSSLTFVPQFVGSTSSPHAVTLSNFGSVVLTISSIAITGVNSGDFAESDTCGGSVAPNGGTCILNVTFTPTAIGTRNGAVTITDDDGGVSGSTQTVTLTGTGISSATVPIPFVSQPVVPASAAPGGPAFTLTLNGTGFLSNAVVNWSFVNGGIATTTTLTPNPACTPTQCKVLVTAALISAPGTADITVVIPGAPAKTSNTVFFQVSSQTLRVGFGQTNYAAGNSPQSVAAADFNGDGILDLAVANNADSTISILLGNPDGTFTVGSTMATGTGPQWVVAGDFNNDGILDLAVANNTANTISILLGNADGTFQPKTDIVVGAGSAALAVGDFNLDGNLDIAVVNTTANNFQILLGGGDGTFAPPLTNSLTKNEGPSAVAVGDLNGDGILDLAISEKTSGNVSVLLGKGDGTFQPQTDHTLGQTVSKTASNASSLVIADLNNDNNPDIVVCDPAAVGVVVLLGTGNAAFKAPVFYGTGPTPFFVLAGDFNSDGNLDLAITDTSANQISLLLGIGDGTFPNQTSVQGLSGGSPMGMAAGDFNGDGRLDLATANSGSSSVGILLQGPQAALSPTGLGYGKVPVGTTSPQQTVSLTNSGSSLLTIQSISISGANGADFALVTPATGTPCPTAGGTLVSGGSCIIAVTFTPSVVAAEKAAITVIDDAPDSPQSANLTGTGIAPAVTLSSSALSFISLDVGQTSLAQTVTVTNSGTDTLTFKSITSTTGDFIISTDCLASPPNLAPNGMCSISVKFQPLATGTRPGSVVITDNANSSPQNITLSGVGVAPAATLTPSAGLTFVNPQLVNTSSPTQTVIVNNSGSGSLLIASIAISGANSSDFAQSNTCGTSVGGNGGSCIITVTFKPRATGTRTATLTIVDNNNGVNNTQQTETLTGTGVAPTAFLSSTTVNFPDQPVGKKSGAVDVTLTNTGTAALTIATITLTGTNFGDFSQSSPTCPFSPATLAVGASCTISVTFTPLTQGARTANIVITDNDAGVNGSTQTVTLTGKGSGASVTLTPSSGLTFTSQPVGIPSNSQTATLMNTGGLTDTVTAIKTNPAADFTETDNCIGPLAPGASCIITVIFTPKSVGSFSGLLEVQDTAPNSPHSITLTGTGADFSLGITPTSATISAGQTASFNLQVSPGGGFNQTVALTCSGNPAQSLCGISPANSVTLDGINPANFFVNLTTTARSMLVSPENTSSKPGPWRLWSTSRYTGAMTLITLWLLILASLTGYFALGRRRARLGFSLAVLGVLLFFSVALPACGGGSVAPPLPVTGTPAGTYTLTITGTDGTLINKTSVTVTVN